MSPEEQIVGIVEDDESLLKSLDRFLDTLGIATELYSSAEEYLDRAATSKATCLLLDINLSGLSGIELVRRLAASGSRLPVIFMTALHEEATYQDALATGCVACLQKPILGTVLIEALRKAA